MQAFIAFTENDARKFDLPSLNVSPDYFGPSGAYVPLKTSREAAVKAALEANQAGAAKAATETTQWRMLVLTLDESEHTECVNRGGLFHSADGIVASDGIAATVRLLAPAAAPNRRLVARSACSTPDASINLSPEHRRFQAVG